MNDTPEAVQNFYRTLLMCRSGSERLHMGCAMFDTARAVALANLRASSHSDDELRVRLFVRTYDGDFDPATAERIAVWLSIPRPQPLPAILQHPECGDAPGGAAL
jgi:hypothetical protein